jgi:hypothetical protein
MIELICLLLLIIISCIYNGYIIINHKEIPTSLSETSYMLGNKKYYWFSLYTLIISSILLPILFNHINENLTFLPFLFCSGLLFAGFSPFFKEKNDKQVHYTAAIISFIAFVVFLSIYMGWQWLIIYIILLILLCLWKKTKYVYFAEILALFFIVLWLFYKILFL